MDDGMLEDSRFRVCTRCVMDTTDPEITFNADGVCSHCVEFDTATLPIWFPNKKGAELWEAQVQRIKAEGRGKEYDCILGLSGGVDSSYLALKAHEAGLRPLVVHVDAGWNSELAVSNIEAIVKHCEFDLHTHVMDWEDMRDLHLSYLRAGIPNQDVPQDHAFFANLYKMAVENDVKYVLSGGNIATEAIFPKSWQGPAMDAINLKSIHKQFGARQLKRYQTISFFDYYIYFPLIKKMKVLRPLNFMPYDKNEAIAYLSQQVGWKKYDRKHGESLFTKIFQNFYLPERYGYDKRKPHLSSLIVSGQLTRGKALEILQDPLYEKQELENDLIFFCKKLRISMEEFDALCKQPLRRHTDFPTWDRRYKALKATQGLTERLVGRRINVYS